MRLIPVVSCIGLLASTGVAQTSVMLEPLRDTSIFEADLGGISNGAGQYLFTGVTAMSIKRRAMISFDLSSIPADAVITDVILTMHMSRTVSTGTPVGLHAMSRNWGEAGSDAPGEEGGGAPAEDGDATWTHAFHTRTAWTSFGGDFEEPPSAMSIVAGIGFYQWSSPELIADVQSWLEDSPSNFGWMILGDESPGVTATAKRFDSREHPDPALRPSLSVSYIVPTPGTLSIIGVGALVLRRRGRKP
ncbi:MAG TPA: DNRLRE domain-containing protein [Phycisphaerales bacterium]|nr:DNRLRE domain-containing protein [Phycisphaerales bacterium]